MMKVLAPGTDVTIEQASIPGKISSVNIHSDHVRYEVIYYVDYSQRTATLAENEYYKDKSTFAIMQQVY